MQREGFVNTRKSFTDSSWCLAIEQRLNRFLLLKRGLGRKTINWSLAIQKHNTLCFFCFFRKSYLWASCKHQIELRSQEYFTTKQQNGNRIKQSGSYRKFGERPGA